MVNIYEILQKIGFDWQVALANLVNFVIILFLLKKFAFKPVGKIIRDRQDKINTGLEKAREADIRLHEVDGIAKNMLKKAEQESRMLISDTQQRAKEMEDMLVKKAEDRYATLLRQADADYQKQQALAKQTVLQGAAELIKRIIVKTVELSPKDIDEALIKKAVTYLEKE